MGIKKLRKLQFGLESTSGTAVAATTVYRAENATIQDDLEVVHPPEDIGIAIGTDRTYIPYKKASLSIPDHPATFEQIGYTLSASIENIVSGASDGSGTGKIFTYALPTTATKTIKTYTIEGGDDQEAERFAYGFCKSWKLSGKAQEALMLSSEWSGREVGLNAFTSISVPTVEEMLFQQTKMYIDPVTTFPATTQKVASVLSFELSCNTGWVENFTADGTLYFTNHRFDGDAFDLLLNVTFEHNAIGAAEKVAWRAQTPRAIKLLTEGSTYAQAGTAYSKKTFIANLLGKWEKFEKLDSINGNDIVTGTLRCKYDPTAASSGSFILVSTVSPLT